MVADFFQTATPYLILLLTGLGVLYRFEVEKRREVESQVSEKKYKAYLALIDLFFDLFKETKGGKKMNQTDIQNRMIDAMKDLMLFASDDVLTLVQTWSEESRQGRIDLNRLGEMIVAIRKDMGNRRTKVGPDDVLRQIILDYEHMKASGGLIVRKPPMEGRG